MSWRTFFKGLQGAAVAVAGVAVAQPNAFAPFIPTEHQGQVLGALVIASAILPSIAPRGVRAAWGGGQGGTAPATQAGESK